MTPRYFAFDTETSGLDPVDGAEILSYAYIVLDREMNEISRRQRFFLPERPVDPRAAAVNGFTTEKWVKSGALLPSEVGQCLEIDLKSIGAKVKPLGHNIPFDLRFLSHYLPRQRYLDYHATDTMVLAAALDDAAGIEGRYNLTVLCERYGVVLDNAHDSLGDIEATVALYRELIRRLKGVDVPAAGNKHFMAGANGTRVLSFGANKGRTLREVKAVNPGYLRWMLANLSDLEAADRAEIEAVQ